MTMKCLPYISVIVALLLTSCDSKPTSKAPVVMRSDAVSLQKMWSTDTVSLITPESVLYDPMGGRYFVSCIGAVPPTARDGDGYIATIDLSGTVIDSVWMGGLDAPKGMGLYNDTLYITDIDEIVRIDLKTKATDRISVAGATFLNDIDISEDGTVYVTDMGTNTIHKLSGGNVEVVLKKEQLGQVNGVSASGGNLYLSAMGTGDVQVLNVASGQLRMIAKGGVPGGDGIQPWSAGHLVSNWNGEVYYVKDTLVDLLLDTKKLGLNAADIEINAEEALLLVPTFFGNSVEAYKIL